MTYRGSDQLQIAFRGDFTRYWCHFLSFPFKEASFAIFETLNEKKKLMVHDRARMVRTK